MLWLALPVLRAACFAADLCSDGGLTLHGMVQSHCEDTSVGVSDPDQVGICARCRDDDGALAAVDKFVDDSNCIEIGVRWLSCCMAMMTVRLRARLAQLGVWGFVLVAMV